MRNPWDDYAEEYAAFAARRAPQTFDREGMLARLLDLRGDMDGKTALDAACGMGSLARAMADRGALVTGIDLSPRLVAMARAQADAAIDFRVGDLAEPQPALEGRFDLIGSYLALNDVERYREFAATLASLARPHARIGLLFNNPYSSIVRDHVRDYFDRNAMGTYLGLWQQGIRARYYHRPLEDYLDAFLEAGLQLVKLVDLPDVFGLDWLLPPDRRFPRFMALVFTKPGRAPNHAVRS